MDAARAAVLRRGINLELAGLAWMFVEAVLAVGAGIVARSVLLTAFGIDSVVELLSGIVLIRRLSAELNGSWAQGVERLEVVTARLSAVLLIILCGYVVISSIAGFALGVKPSASLLGLAVCAAALAFMPLLAVAKSRVNNVLQSASLRADIAETVSCAYLAGVALLGLAAAILFNAWWAQSIAALALLIWLVPEAREALEAGRERQVG